MSIPRKTPIIKLSSSQSLCNSSTPHRHGRKCFRQWSYSVCGVRHKLAVKPPWGYSNSCEFRCACVETILQQTGTIDRYCHSTIIGMLQVRGHLSSRKHPHLMNHWFWEHGRWRLVSWFRDIPVNKEGFPASEHFGILVLVVYMSLDVRCIIPIVVCFRLRPFWTCWMFISQYAIQIISWKDIVLNAFLGIVQVIYWMPWSWGDLMRVSILWLQDWQASRAWNTRSAK